MATRARNRDWDHVRKWLLTVISNLVLAQSDLQSVTRSI